MLLFQGQCKPSTLSEKERKDQLPASGMNTVSPLSRRIPLPWPGCGATARTGCVWANWSSGTRWDREHHRAGTGAGALQQLCSRRGSLGRQKYPEQFLEMFSGSEVVLSWVTPY